MAQTFEEIVVMQKTKAPAEAKDSKAPAQTIQKQPEMPDQRGGPVRPGMVQRAASALPPPNGAPPAARAREMLVAPETGLGAPTRARMSAVLQRQSGNARLSRSLGATVQAKLTVGAPNDEYEQEADQVADRAMRMAQPSHEAERPADIQPALVQRQVSADARTTELSPEIESKITSSRGGGNPLSESERSFAEPRFGMDFGGVRVHNDDRANKVAGELNAQALTSGQDIYFGAGTYQPGTQQGDHLLAHELTHVVQQREDGANLQRALSPHYSSIVEKLSYGALDWAITDQEAREVLDWLQPLSDTDLSDTILRLERDGYLNRLMDNINSSDRTRYATLIQRIQSARSTVETANRIQSLLSYGILDWAITDDDARQVLENLQSMQAARRRVVVNRLEQNGYFQRLLDNISATDRSSFAALISELNGYRDEFRDQMHGTSVATSAAKRDVEALLTPGITRDPVTGAPAPFVDVIAGRTYRQHIEEKLDDVRAWMYPQSQALLARHRLPMTRFEGIGVEAKKQTDALFGHLATGPAFRAGTRASGANIIDRSLQTPDASDLVRYLIHNQDEVIPVHTQHSAIPSRAAERAIIASIIISYSTAHRPELEVIDRAWPAVAGGGIVEIQPFESTTAAGTRRMLWESFQTMIHEYLHTITHPNYNQVARSLGGAEESILIEGGTSLFTDEVWNTLWPEEVRANEELRANVEGTPRPFDASVVPPISHYRQITQARDIQTRVGEANMRAAYFLGHTEGLGLGPTWTPASAAMGNKFVVPPSGVNTVPDVARLTGASADSIAAANGINSSARVVPGQQLTVPGLRVHTVLPGGIDTRAEIARRNGVTEAQLELANPGVNWGALSAGQRIVIPIH
jgi:hypothetical protein